MRASYGRLFVYMYFSVSTSRASARSVVRDESRRLGNRTETVDATKTMEMLEKMYTGWQTSLEEALTEMRISSEAERKQAVEKARTDVQRHLTRAEADFRRLKEQYQVEQTRRKAAHNKLIELSTF